MGRIKLVSLTLAAGLLMVVGCKSITNPVNLDEFTWYPMPNPEGQVSKANALSAVSILYIQGMIKTPSPCYDLSGDFKKKGKDLTLTVHAEEGLGTNCDSGTGAFQYTAVINNLGRRTFDLRVLHRVENGEDKEYNLTVTVVQ